ncbi:hypothetical protein SESBI_30684 [Sesbania bispinosa]|nr:hypothetical protein SESBI_30684 [Sesbania bispinosa]
MYALTGLIDDWTMGAILIMATVGVDFVDHVTGGVVVGVQELVGYEGEEAWWKRASLVEEIKSGRGRKC